MPTTTSSTDGITQVDLADLLALRVRAGKPVPRPARIRTPLAGAHVSALRGRGMDYAESRVYQPGDDARNIDWRRTARSGEWHTKLFQAEREHSLLLLIDTHATMRFGTRARYKSVTAARAAAWLAWTCVRSGDRVGALAFGDVRAAVDPHAGTRGALAVLGALARWDERAAEVRSDDTGGEPLSAALARARRLVTPGSRVVLLSDGWCTDAAASPALARLGRRTALQTVIVVDALERELAPPGTYEFESGSTRRSVALTSPATRAQFRERLAGGRKRLAEACDSAAVARTLLAAGDEPDVALASLLNPRGRRA